jgi:hypothetical protein
LFRQDCQIGTGHGQHEQGVLLVNVVKINHFWHRQPALEPLQAVAFRGQLPADFEEPARTFGRDFEHHGLVAAARFPDDWGRHI